MIEKLKNMIPDNVLAELPLVMQKYTIDTPLRLAHFISQCSYESRNFALKSENLNYSAQALYTIFRKYFPTIELAQLYERQPEKIANKIYANRMGNGDEASGDGWNYKGAGYIQLTGKNNFSYFSKSVPEDIIANPAIVADKYPLLSAAFFWNTNHLNAIADLGDTDEVVRRITKVINGGTIGLSDRIILFKHFINKLNIN